MFQLNEEQSTSTSAYTLRIDLNQAAAHLEALGYNRDDAVYVRAFLSKEDPHYGPNTGRKADKLNWEQIEQWQAQGYGIYIVVNGGGHKDENVTHCRAIFCEFDDRPIEDQISFWQELGLPEPSLQIATRKSVHTYWVFAEPLPVEQWRELQVALLAYTGSDQSLKNPSRVMRLAGAYHIKPGCPPVRCDIIHQSDKRYSHEDLRAAIPVVQPMQPVLELVPQLEARAHSSNAAPQYQRYEDIQIPVPASVPLEVCLAKESRTLLESGVSEGGRNTNGAKLARDLIGTALHLQTIGQQFDGNPRQLLDEYASCCTPPLPAKEVEAIWKSAEKDRPGPSCKAEGVKTCLRAWYWNHQVKPHQATWKDSARNGNGHRSGRGFGSGGSGSSNSTQPPIATVSLCDRISEIINRYSLESLQVSALMDLATATGRTYNEINQLARIIRSEGELADEVIEAVKSFRGILNSCHKRLDIQKYLDPLLAKALLAKASAMPTACEYLFNTLLAASASRIGTAAQIIIKPEGGYKQPCILWTANVSHSGQAKTPPQQEIIAPLEEMESQASELYDAQLQDYEQDDDNDAKPPVRQRRLLNNVTSSTKIRLHGQNPRGLLEYIDELVADYSRLNQYKAGKGDDLQLELGFWNGAAVSYDRHDVQLFLKHTGFSKTGTYQWDTLARLMADEVNFIASGYSARFLYCSILDAPSRYLNLLSPSGNDTLAQLLGWLYGELEKLPEADYLLSYEAKVLFQGWNHALVNAEIEESYFGLSLVYAKIEANTARIALWLHIVNAVLHGEKPAPVIGGETMQHAIEIASFYLWQHKLIHAHNSPTRKLEGIFLKVQTQAEKFFAKCGKGVGASFLKTRINALKGWVVEKIRSTVFKALVVAGHGRIEGEGAEMIYIPNTVPENVPPDFFGAIGGVDDALVAPPIAENTTTAGIQTPVGEIGAEVPPTIIFQQSVGVTEAPQEYRTVARQSAQVGKPAHAVGCSTTGCQSAQRREPSLHAAGSKPSARHCPHQTLRSTGGTSARECLHQFTNFNAENTSQRELQMVGDTTNLPPIPPTSPTVQDLAAKILLCQTWVAAAETVSSAERETSTGIPMTPTCVADQTQATVLQRGQRVRVVLPGSQRDGKTGVVRRVIADSVGHKYEVWLDDASIRRDLREMLCCPGWLQAIACNTKMLGS
jgi:hypothetical protein